MPPLDDAERKVEALRSEQQVQQFRLAYCKTVEGEYVRFNLGFQRRRIMGVFYRTISLSGGAWDVPESSLIFAEGNNAFDARGNRLDISDIDLIEPLKGKYYQPLTRDRRDSNQ